MVSVRMRQDVYEDRLKMDRSEDRKVFSQVHLYVC